MTVAASLPPEAALRSLVENALSPDTLGKHPDVVERLVEHQRHRAGNPADWKALASAGVAYSGGIRQARIRAPTLIMCGELGHLFFWEDPARFAQTVTSFLLSRPEGA